MKEVKVLVNATRLKPYFDPAERPTNTSTEYEHLTQPLNPEQITDLQPQPQPTKDTEQTNTPTNPAQQDTPQAPNKGKHPKNLKYKAKIKKSKTQATDPSTTTQPPT